MQEARPVQHSVTQVSRQQYANLHPNRQPAIRPATAQAAHASAPGPRIEPRSQSQAEVRRPSAQIAPQSRSHPKELGRAQSRERVCQDVSIPVVDVTLKKKKNNN